LEPKRVYPLALENIRPVIRIAHRGAGRLRLAERIIFDHELVLVLHGAGTLHSRTERVDFAGHDLLFIPPFVPHRFDGEADEHLAVHFDFAPGVPAAGKALERRQPYEVRFPENRQLPRLTRLVQQDRIEREFATLVDCWQHDGAVGALEAVAALLHILAMLLRRTPADPAAQARARLAPALALLAESAHGEPAAALARACGLSVSHFHREFREWTGYAPLEYQRWQKVIRARELLAAGRLTIKEVAAAVGFADPYHFSRVFRQLDGLSPSQYRAAAMSGASIK
jgi:AraC-like DNA-binding protein